MRATVRLLFVSPLLLCVPLSACAFDVVPLGEDEADAFRVGQGPGTRHLAEAIEGGGDLTLRDLFDQADNLVFNAAPDPTQLLRDTAALDDQRSRPGRHQLRVLSWNVALLDANIFGFIDYAATPHLAERRASMPGIALTAGHDVIAVQELWLDEDVSLWRTAAAEHGYLMFVGDRGGFNTGLATFVREEIVQGGSMRTFAEKSFAHVDASEFFPGPGIKRGYQHTGFVHRDIGPVRIFNAHLWPYPANWKGRMWQVRELGIATRTESAADEVILVAGDMNAGPYYKSATWRTPDGGEETSWFHNTISYPLLLVYGELVDLAVMGRPATDAASDVTLGNTVINDPEQATSIPGAEDGWCTRTPQSTFTGTDCNALYFEQYAGTEYPARLDHILAHDPDGRIVVQNSSLAFTEPRRFGGLTIEPSDHYGVAVELLVSSP